MNLNHHHLLRNNIIPQYPQGIGSMALPTPPRVPKSEDAQVPFISCPSSVGPPYLQVSKLAESRDV